MARRGFTQTNGNGLLLEHRYVDGDASSVGSVAAVDASGPATGEEIDG